MGGQGCFGVRMPHQIPLPDAVSTWTRSVYLRMRPRHIGIADVNLFCLSRTNCLSAKQSERQHPICNNIRSTPVQGTCASVWLWAFLLLFCVYEYVQLYGCSKK